MATPNSGCGGKVCRAFALLLLLSLADRSANLTAENAHGESPAQRVERAYQQARQRAQQSTNDLRAAWELGRACFDWAEFAGSDKQRGPLALEGIAACRRAVDLDSKSAAAHYYLGMNLGQLARTKLLGALKLVKEMEAEWLAAIAADATFDFAGPHRSLGMLYRDAPGWPTSVGNRAKARQHLQKAVDVSPDYPDNRLALLEAWLTWGEREKVQSQLAPVGQVLAAARKKLSGDAWQPSWEDWDRRWSQIQEKAAGPSSKREAPRQKQ